MTKHSLMSSILLAGIIVLTLFYMKKNEHTQERSFIVGTAGGYAPFVSINEVGDYEGFDIDVSQALADTLGKKLELRDLGSMTSLFMALEQGSIDAIIWGLSITADRLKKVAMVHYQGESVIAYPLIFWNKIPDGVAKIEDMDGMTICVEPTSSQDTVLSRYTFVNKLSIEKVDDALLNIQYGKADAALVEPAIAKKFKNKYPEIKIISVPLVPTEQEQGVGIAIKQGHAELIKQVQEVVQELKSTGIINQLEQKWGIA